MDDNPLCYIYFCAAHLYCIYFPISSLFDYFSTIVHSSFNAKEEISLFSIVYKISSDAAFMEEWSLYEWVFIIIIWFKFLVVFWFMVSRREVFYCGVLCAFIFFSISLFICSLALHLNFQFNFALLREAWDTWVKHKHDLKFRHFAEADSRVRGPQTIWAKN